MNFAAVFLIILFPFLNYLNVNKGEAAFDVDIFVTESGIACAILVFSVLIISFFVSRLRWFDFFGVSFSLSFVILFLFVFDIVHGYLEGVVGKQAIIVYNSSMFLIFLSILLLHRFQSFEMIVRIFSVVVTIVPISQIGMFFLLSDGEGSVVEAQNEDASFKYSNDDLEKLDRPNIYYVLVDAYSGEKSLKKFLGLDIGEFLEKVRARDVHVADDTRSPYNMTFLSVASILNAKYIIDEMSPPYKDRKRFYPGLMKHGPEPAVVRHFESLGYKFNFLGNRWARCYNKYVNCPNAPDGTLMSYEIRGLYEATPFAWYQQGSDGNFLEVDPAATVDAIGNLLTYVVDDGRPTSPSFFFVHHFPPHPPYIFKPDCSVRDTYRFDFRIWNKRSIPLYIDNLHCTNKRIMSLFEWLDEHDPNAIVVVTGDHGTGFTSLESVEERLSTLTLARFPERCQDGLGPRVNSINLMRMAMACAQNSSPRLIENKSFMGSYRTKGDGAGKVRLVPR